MESILKHKTMILGLGLLFLVGMGLFLYESGKPAATDGVTKTAVTSSSLTSASPSTGPDQQFVSQLLAIQNINFNLDLFKDPVYIGLQDFSQPINPQPIGRENPFAPYTGASVSGVDSSQSADAAFSSSSSAIPPAPTSASTARGTRTGTAPTSRTSRTTVKK